MKKIISLTVLLLTVFSTASAFFPMSYSREEVTEVILSRDIQNGAQPRLPEQNPLVFECYAIGTFNVLLLSANQSILADIKVINYDSGTMDVYSQYLLSSVAQWLPLTGSGSYNISVSLPNGESYSGEFEL